MMILFLVAGLVLAWVFRSKVKTTVAPGKRNIMPEAVGVLVMTAQVSELLHVVEHITIVNLVAAVLMLTIVVAYKTGAESELY